MIFTTAAQFLYDRTQHHALSTYMSSEPQILEEDPELDPEDSEHDDSLRDSSNFNKPVLDDIQQGENLHPLSPICHNICMHVWCSALIVVNLQQSRISRLACPSVHMALFTHLALFTPSGSIYPVWLYLPRLALFKVETVLCGGYTIDHANIMNAIIQINKISNVVVLQL